MLRTGTHPSGGVRTTQLLQDTRMAGARLRVASIAWTVLITLCLSLFVMGLGFSLDQIRATAASAVAFLGHLEPSTTRDALIGLVGSGAYPVVIFGLEVGLVVTLSGTAIVIYGRRSADWMAMFVALAFISYGVFITPTLDALRIAIPASAFAVAVAQAMGVGAALLFFFLVPDGRFVPRWTFPVAVVWALWNAASVFVPDSPMNFSNLRPYSVLHGLLLGPTTIPEPEYVATLLSFATIMTFWISGCWAQIVRYRTDSSAVRRRQTKWIVVALNFAIAGYAALMIPRLVVPALREPGVPNLVFHLVGTPIFLVVILLVPLFVAFSILRYHLWDIEVLVNRTLVYGALTITLVGAYIVSIVVGLAVLSPFTGRSEVAVAVATLAVATLFQPMRARIQRTVDRRFYRSRYDAGLVISTFADRLATKVELDSLRAEVLSSVAETMHPTYVSVWLRSRSGPS